MRSADRWVCMSHESVMSSLLLCWTTFLVIIVPILIVFAIRRKIRGSNTGRQHHVIKAPDKFDMSTEVVVVGAGIAGSAMSASLGKFNRKVLVIERDLSEPDRIVGELLQPGGYSALVNLGLRDAAEGIDSHIVHGYVIHDRDSDSLVKLTYPVDSAGNIQTGRSFHHGRFVMGLRKQAKQQESVSLIEGTVNFLLENTSGEIVGVEYKDKATGRLKTVEANLVIVADGCFSKFRKDLVSASVSVCSNFVGLILHNVPQCAKGHAELVLGSTGPILLYQISSTCTRVLIDVPQMLPSNIKRYLEINIYPQLPEYVKDPFLEALKEGRIRSMPNSFLPALPSIRPGVFILGDAFNMRHPMTGAGMSVALNDTLLLTEILQSVPSFKDKLKLQNAFKKFHLQRKRSHSFVINVLAQALYALFSSPTGHMNDLRQACFEYFKLGGRCVSDPVGLLSVLKPYPAILITHFFIVVFYAIYRSFKKHLLALRPDLAFYKTLMILFSGCSLIFPLIFSELQSILLSFDR